MVIIIERSSLLILFSNSDFESANDFKGCFSINLTICHPKPDSNGCEISPLFSNENAALSKASELNCPVPKRCKTPPLTAVDLSSENWLANASKLSPC